MKGLPLQHEMLHTYWEEPKPAMEGGFMPSRTAEQIILTVENQTDRARGHAS